MSDIGSPIFLPPTNSRQILPGILLTEQAPFVACSGLSSSGSGEITASTVQIEKGVPRILSVQEALVRFLIGRDGVRTISRISSSYSVQKELLLRMLEELFWDNRVRWARWEFWGHQPVMVLREDEFGAILLLSCKISKKKSYRERLDHESTIIGVDSSEITPVDPAFALKYFVCFNAAAQASIEQYNKGRSESSLQDILDSNIEKIWSALVSDSYGAPCRSEEAQQAKSMP